MDNKFLTGNFELLADKPRNVLRFACLDQNDSFISKRHSNKGKVFAHRL